MKRLTPAKYNEDLTKPPVRVLTRGRYHEKQAQTLGNQYWRLNNLYFIVDKWRNKVLFRMNESQEHFYRNMWYWNLIPKSRQLGFSTLIDLMALDTALFNDNTVVNIIAHTLDKAEELFHQKIKFAYDNLPEEILKSRLSPTSNVRELKFSNNSIISVDTSVRGGTSHFLHVSEFGLICALSPDRAKKLVEGSLPAIHPGNMVFIESTSEGSIGYFADWCKDANDRQVESAKSKQPLKLNKRQFKLNFYPWWLADSNRLEPDEVVIYSYAEKYFEELKLKHDIKLDAEQKAWYANEWLIYKDGIKRQAPSFFEECFWESTEGSYYKAQFHKIREDGRITKVPWMPGYPVDTSWDLGIGAPMVIWFAQTVGRERHYIDYYEDSGEGLEFYIDLLKQKEKELGYHYGRHIAPHDIDVRELGARAGGRSGVSRWETAARLGVVFDTAPNISVDEGIEATRQLLGVAWFDKDKCHEGYIKLENYKKAWDAKHGIWKNYPALGEANHASDAFRMDALTWRDPMYASNIKIKPKQVRAAGWT